ncbi:phage FluMu protein gp41 [Stenotrophomonas sp. BIGb0135]|nr:phage FluMu protein gp41 [Stenotrophomonas sp. BIGb0135]
MRTAADQRSTVRQPTNGRLYGCCVRRDIGRIRRRADRWSAALRPDVAVSEGSAAPRGAAVQRCKVRQPTNGRLYGCCVRRDIGRIRRRADRWSAALRSDVAVSEVSAALRGAADQRSTVPQPTNGLRCRSRPKVGSTGAAFAAISEGSAVELTVGQLLFDPTSRHRKDPPHCVRQPTNGRLYGCCVRRDIGRIRRRADRWSAALRPDVAVSEGSAASGGAADQRSTVAQPTNGRLYGVLRSSRYRKDPT